MIKLTCLSFMYPDEMCVIAFVIMCVHMLLLNVACVISYFFSFKSSFFVSEIASYCCLKNEDVQIYQRRLPWNLFYKIHHRLIDMNIHSSVKVILCTIYLNLSKDTKFGSRHNEQEQERTTQHNWSFVCEYGYFISKRQANSSTRIIYSHV